MKIDEITKQIMEKLTAKLELALKETPKETAVFTMAEMDTQLDSGMGLDKPLEGYSAHYKTLREVAGLTSSPNLTVTGDMRNSMIVVEKENSAEIVFTSFTPSSRYATIFNVAGAKLRRALVGKKTKRMDTLKEIKERAKNVGTAIPNATKAFYTNQTRPWIGLGNAGANKVAKAIANLILKRLKK